MVRTALVIFGLFEMSVRILLLRVCWLALLCMVVVCVWIWELAVRASVVLSKVGGKRCIEGYEVCI
jgi:hypothetical protein